MADRRERRVEPRSILPLAVRGLSYDAGGQRLVDGVDLTLRAGSRTVILGPNGAGKSLLLRLLHGLIPADAGEIRWAGAKPDRRVRQRQAMVFQKPVLLRRTVAANIAFALAARGVPRRERRSRLDEALAMAGLERQAARPARRLSGGEQQRLALARALAVEPEILFLDEPTANLDPGATLAVETLIAEAHHRGTKIVMVTHDLGQSSRLADEIGFMHHGRLLELLPAKCFFAGPQSTQARNFIAGRLVL